MGDSSHEKIEAYFEDMLSDPLIALVMQADGIDPHAMKQRLSRASLRHYPRAAPDDAPAAVPADYRPSVGVALFNRAGQVFIGRRSDLDFEAWQMPQGGIDPGETLEDAARRELREEIGTDNVIVLGERGGWLQYDLPPHLMGKIWGGAWRGQKLHWFAMGFLGVDKDIDVHTAHPEFGDWRWADLDELPRLIVDFKRAAYQNVANAFSPIPVVLAAAARSELGHSWPNLGTA
ncbi:RNA pyrophosphohydrolase [Sphingomonas oryzagri]